MNSGRLSVALTVDFDAFSAVLAEEGPPDRTWLSFAEFGPRVGADRLLELLSERGWRITWFIPGQTIEVFPDVCERIHAGGHEVAHHGYCHEDPSSLDEAAERRMLERGIKAITDLTGEMPRGYRAPFWRSSWRTQELLIEYGFSYDSSLMSGDLSPHLYRAGDRLMDDPPFIALGDTQDLVEVPVAWHREDGGHYEIASAGGGPLRPPSELSEQWDADFRFGLNEVPGGVLTLTVHPEISGRAGRLANLFRLLDDWASISTVDVVRLDEFVDQWRPTQ